MFEIGVEHPLQAGIALAVGAVLSLGLGWLRSRRAGIASRRLALVTVLLPLLSAFFSHLLYCLVNAESVLYGQSFGTLFAFWQPGTMMYGGMLGALLALLLSGGADRAKLAEAYAPSFALMTAFARVAEGCMGQGYGEYWFEEETAFCRFPFMVYDPYYEAWAWALFMLGALLAFALYVYLMARRARFAGEGMLTFFGFYAAAQIVLESLRRDEFLRWGFVRVEEVFSGVAVLAVLVILCVRAGQGRILSKALCFALFAAMVVLCLLLEFATEGRIPFLFFLDTWQCYVVMAGACVVIAACVVWMRRLAARPQVIHS